MTAKSERYHGLDLLRGFAMMLGLLMHASMAYSFPELFEEVGVAMPEEDPVNDWIYLLMGWIHQWRMPLFFVLAGFFGCMIAQRRGARAFLQDRLLRIGLTLVIFAPLFDLLYPPFDFELGHLWFLYYLMGVSLVASIIAWVIVRVEWAASLARLLARPAKGVGTLALFLLPLTALTPFAREQGWAVIPDYFGDFDLLPFLYYCLWFGMGAALYWHRETLVAFKSWPMIGASLVTALLTMAGGFDALFAIEEYTGQWYEWAIFSAVSTATWCLFFIGLSLRILNRKNRVVSWFVELSYPIYLLHLLPSVIIGAFFISVGWSAGLAFWPIVLGAFISSVAGYYILIKFTPLDWLLAGPRKAWFRPKWIGLGRTG